MRQHEEITPAHTQVHTHAQKHSPHIHTQRDLHSKIGWAVHSDGDVLTTAWKLASLYIIATKGRRQIS